jgi:hypothetical protein
MRLSATFSIQIVDGLGRAGPWGRSGRPRRAWRPAAEAVDRSQIRAAPVRCRAGPAVDYYCMYGTPAVVGGRYVTVTMPRRSAAAAAAAAGV